jgi:anti-sigma B factor antagonist
MEVCITSEPQNDAHVVNVSGDLDVYTAPELKQALDSLSLDRRTIVVDLSRVHFIDSTALGVLVGAVQQKRQADRELMLVVEDPHLLKIFRITGFDMLFTIYPQVAEALAAV